MDKLPKLLNKMVAIAQNGLTFAKDPYDIQRYEQLRELASEFISDHSQHALEDVAKWISADVGYMTPKIDVRAAVFRDGKILMVRERSDNKWSLPGGWADVNDSASASVEREVLEEAGYIVKATKLFALYDKHKHAHPTQLPHTYKAFFLCDLLGGEPQENIEISEISFFERDHLPELSLPRISYEQIERAFVHAADRTLMTEFD